MTRKFTRRDEWKRKSADAEEFSEFSRETSFKQAMDTYTLFKGPKRVTLKDEDMTTDKIGRIFQVMI